MAMNTENVAVGEVVVACMSVQGLIEGEQYEVASVGRFRTFAGTFTRLGVRAIDRTIRREEPIFVGNPHIVFRYMNEGEQVGR